MTQFFLICVCACVKYKLIFFFMLNERISNLIIKSQISFPGGEGGSERSLRDFRREISLPFVPEPSFVRHSQKSSVVCARETDSHARANTNAGGAAHRVGYNINRFGSSSRFKVVCGDN